MGQPSDSGRQAVRTGTLRGILQLSDLLTASRLAGQTGKYARDQRPAYAQEKRGLKSLDAVHPCAVRHRAGPMLFQDASDPRLQECRADHVADVDRAGNGSEILHGHRLQTTWVSRPIPEDKPSE